MGGRFTTDGLNDIWLRDGQAFGRLTRLQVADDRANWFELGDVAVTPLSDMDVILMRKDPPFDMNYIFATYVLQRAEEHGALVVNRPQGLRDANEKAILAWFPTCAPPTLISRSLEEMHAFISEHHKVVVKPLDLMGGESVFVTDANDGNHNVIFETVADKGSRYVMVQKYLPEITESGDKRILLIDGKPVPMALARIPSPGDPSREHGLSEREQRSGHSRTATGGSVIRLDPCYATRVCSSRASTSSATS